MLLARFCHVFYLVFGARLRCVFGARFWFTFLSGFGERFWCGFMARFGARFWRIFGALFLRVWRVPHKNISLKNLPLKICLKKISLKRICLKNFGARYLRAFLPSFSVPLQTNPVAQPATCTIKYRTFPGDKTARA